MKASYRFYLPFHKILLAKILNKIGNWNSGHSKYTIISYLEKLIKSNIENKILRPATWHFLLFRLGKNDLSYGKTCKE